MQILTQLSGLMQAQIKLQCGSGSSIQVPRGSGSNFHVQCGLRILSQLLCPPQPRSNLNVDLDPASKFNAVPNTAPRFNAAQNTTSRFNSNLHTAGSMWVLIQLKGSIQASGPGSMRLRIQLPGFDAAGPELISILTAVLYSFKVQYRHRSSLNVDPDPATRFTAADPASQFNEGQDPDPGSSRQVHYRFGSRHFSNILV
jgi:hypothetical protein